MKNILNSSEKELSVCNGLGSKKVERLYMTFNASFTKKSVKKKNGNKKIEDFLKK